MKKLLFLVLMLGCFQINTAQDKKEREPETNTLEVTYVGFNNNAYYFKTTEDKKVWSFEKISETAKRKMESILNTSKETYLITVKTSFIKQKKELNSDDEKTTSITTYKKEFSLLDIEVLDSDEDLEDFDDDKNG